MNNPTIRRVTKGLELYAVVLSFALGFSLVSPVVHSQTLDELANTETKFQSPHSGMKAAETLNYEKNRNLLLVENPAQSFSGTKLGDSFFVNAKDPSPYQFYSELTEGVPNGATMVWDTERDDLAAEADFSSGVPQKILIYDGKTKKLEMNFQSGRLFELKTDSGQILRNVSDTPEKRLTKVTAKKISVDARELRQFRDKLKEGGGFEAFKSARQEMKRLPSGVASQVFQELGLAPEGVPPELMNPQALSSSEIKRLEKSQSLLSANEFSKQLPEIVANFLGAKIEAPAEGTEVDANSNIDPSQLIRKPTQEPSNKKNLFESASLEP